MKNKESGLVQLACGCWESLAGVRGRFYVFVVFFVVAYALELGVPWTIGYSLNAFVADGFTPGAYRAAALGLGMYLGLRVLSAVFHHVARYLQATVAYRSRMQVLNTTFRSLLRHELSWHLGAHSGDNITKLNRSARAAESTIGTYLWQILEGLVKIVLATIALTALDGWIALNVLVTGAATIMAIHYFNGRIVARLRLNNLFENKVNRICVDSCANIVTIKTLGLEAPAAGYLERQAPEGAEHVKGISRLNEMKWAAINAGYSLLIVSSLGIYLWGQRTASGPFDIAAVYVLISYLEKIFQSINSFTTYYGGVMEACTAYEDAAKIVAGGGADENAEAASVQSAWRSLRLEDLKYAYEDKERGGLTAVSMSIARGEKIALVGPSGGGKSTLLKLMGGLLTPSEGTIGYDGSGCRKAVTGQTLLIPQEPEIFSESLRYNLTVGKEIADDELLEMLHLCQLDAFLEKNEEALELDLAEKGLNLSGGEKQRLAIARGLLRLGEKEVLLLDEPTSALDPGTEEKILRKILERFSDKTVIASCHRWHLLPLFDKVAYLADGKLLQLVAADEFVKQTEQFVPGVTLLRSAAKGESDAEQIPATAA